MLVEARENDPGELWADALERGCIVRFARPPVELPVPRELDFLREGLWVTKGTFAELYRKHARDAGVDKADVSPGVAARALAAVLRAGRRAVPMLRVIDSSPYDRAMRRFHNWMKDTPSFQESPDG